jgi:hypothetical protein
MSVSSFIGLIVDSTPALFSFLFFGFVSIVVLGEATSFSIPKTVEFSAGE